MAKDAEKARMLAVDFKRRAGPAMIFLWTARVSFVRLGKKYARRAFLRQGVYVYVQGVVGDQFTAPDICQYLKGSKSTTRMPFSAERSESIVLLLPWFVRQNKQSRAKVANTLSREGEGRDAGGCGCGVGGAVAALPPDLFWRRSSRRHGYLTNRQLLPKFPQLLPPRRQSTRASAPSSPSMNDVQSNQGPWM